MVTLTLTVGTIILPVGHSSAIQPFFTTRPTAQGAFLTSAPPCRRFQGRGQQGAGGPWRVISDPYEVAPSSPPSHSLWRKWGLSPRGPVPSRPSRTSQGSIPEGTGVLGPWRRGRSCSVWSLCRCSLLDTAPLQVDHLGSCVAAEPISRGSVSDNTSIGCSFENCQWPRSSDTRKPGLLC